MHGPERGIGERQPAEQAREGNNPLDSAGLVCDTGGDGTESDGGNDEPARGARGAR
jgi:hypothetical protein